MECYRTIWEESLEGLKIGANTVANVTKSLGLVATLATAYILRITIFFQVCIWIELRFPDLNYIL